MLTDFDILQISETRDPSIIRTAYRKRVKEIHPDVSDESDLIKNHLLFIQINKAYRRLLGNLTDKTGQADTPPPTGAATTQSGVVAHKDPAYVFYKTAMTHFMKIHPSQWRLDVETVLEMPSPRRERELEKIQGRVRELVGLFPRAYYYFSIVVHEYPNSVWSQDAGDKMALIEERTGRYRKIIESFTEHAKTVPRVNKMFFRNRSEG